MSSDVFNRMIRILELNLSAVDINISPHFNATEISELQFATGAIIFNTTNGIHQAFDGTQFRDLYGHQTYPTGQANHERSRRSNGDDIMNQMLQQRIQNLMGDAPMPPMGMQAGGEVDAMPEMMAPNPDAELASAAINEFMMAADTAESPEEANIAKALAEKTATAAQAPMADMAAELAAQGRGGDSVLAHLTPGEVVLPAEMFDDPQFEATVESRFNELDLDPERYVVGMGIASLNANTGLEEFFLKKVGKFFKKVVKKVAPVAGHHRRPGLLAPGPLAALIGGRATNLPLVKG